MSIYLFSKPVHSGKTTALIQWCKHQKSCAGILMPDVDGIRKMYDIKANAFFEAECKRPLASNEELVAIGKYHFYTNAFEQANSILLKGLNNNVEWLIIDEIGKLELAKKGFYSSVNQAIESIVNKEFDGNLLLVVKNSLVQDVVNFFCIKEFQLVEQLSFL